VVGEVEDRYLASWVSEKKVFDSENNNKYFEVL
jgi:hypothetical protein